MKTPKWFDRIAEILPYAHIWFALLCGSAGAVIFGFGLSWGVPGFIIGYRLGIGVGLGLFG